MLRDTKNLCIALASTNKYGYETLSLVESGGIKIADLGKILAVYKTKGKAKRTLTALAKEFKLCKKLLELEKGKGECFGCQINGCYGACVKEELPLKYNLRFREAFTKTRIKTWPFKGPIVIPEGEKAHLIDKWCYLGLLENQNFIADDINKNDLQFDWDTYKILVNYLLKPGNNVKIKTLNG